MDYSSSCSWKVKNFNVTIAVRQSFFVNTFCHRITGNYTGKRWPRILIVYFFWLVFIGLFEFSLFLLLSKDRDLWPALWRYSLGFSSLIVFSWSSMFLFEWLCLMIFISLKLTSKSLDLPVLQTDWESEVWNVLPKSHISSSMLLLLYF